MEEGACSPRAPAAALPARPLPPAADQGGWADVRPIVRDHHFGAKLRLPPVLRNEARARTRANEGDDVEDRPGRGPPLPRLNPRRSDAPLPTAGGYPAAARELAAHFGSRRFTIQEAKCAAS